VDGLSTEVFILPLEDRQHLVFAPLKHAAFVANSNAVDLLQRLGRGEPAAGLVDDEQEFTTFLRHLDLVGGTQGLPTDEVAEGPSRPTTLTLFMTTACNLRCSYCYASAGDTPGEFMPLDTAKRGIDFVVGNAASLKEPVTLAYHGGGEPTANWDVLVQSWQYAARETGARNLGLQALTATNGAISEKKARWIAEHLDGASVSFDGLPHIQDLHRPTASGRGSSWPLEKTLELFDKHDFDYQLRLTVTQELLPFLPHSIEYICDNFRTKNIQVEPIYQEGRGTDMARIDPDEFVELFLQAEAIGKARDRRVYFSAARVGMVTRHFCGVTRDSFALTPTGDVSACYEAFSENSELAPAFFYGRMDEEGQVELDAMRLAALRKRTVEHRPYCQGCFAKWSCAGDCHVKHLEYERTGYIEEPPRCRITRQLTLQHVLDRIADHGGAFWHEPPDALHPVLS